MTVKELYKECECLLGMGLGDKEVMISKDDEGNGFHYLYYSFLTDSDGIKEYTDEQNVVLLG